MTSQPEQLSRYRFNVDEYYKMADAGIFDEDSPVELLDGDIVMLPEQTPPHAACNSRINHRLQSLFRGLAHISVRNPVRLDRYHELIADVTLLHKPSRKYYEAHPGPNDVYVLFQVGDLNRDTDHTIKMRLFGRFGIPELWLIDVVADTVTVCREPYERGYHSLHIFQRGDRVAPLAFPDREIAVTDILGEAETA